MSEIKSPSEKLLPTDGNELFKTSPLRGILNDCIRIYKYCGIETAHSQALELFRAFETPEKESPQKLIELILEAARELKHSAFQGEIVITGISRNETFDLAGKLYELVISQSPAGQHDELLREITFFYLAAGKNDRFLKWSRVLLDEVQNDSAEHRATLFAIGTAQLFIAEPQESENTFKRILSIYPDAPEGYFGLALTHLKLNQLTLYKEMKLKTIQLAPELGEIIDRLSAKDNFTPDDFASEMKNLEDMPNQ